MTLEEILGSNSSNITIKNAKPKVDVGAVMSQYNTYQADAINSPYNKEWKGFIAIENGIKSGLKGLVDVVRMGRDLHIQSALERDPNYQMNDFARSLDDVSDSDMLKTEAVASTSGIGQLGLDVAQGFGQMAPAFVASAAGSPVAGAAVMGASIAGETYDSLRDEGVDVTTAATASAINTAIQTPLEMIGLGKMFKTLPVGSSLSYAARELAERVVTEGVTEFMQEYPDAITRIWAKNADKDASEIAGIVADNIGDITSDAVYSGLIGSILGGGLGGANISMQMALGDSFQRAAERGVHESKLGILERQIGNFAEQGTDADVAGAVVDASSNDARVYVDGEALTAYAQTSAELNNLALSLGVDVEAIKKAADNGSSVAISLGGFEATALKHENFFREVKDNLSFEDGGITNANEKLRQMQAEVKKAEADKAIALEESTALALQEEQDAVLSSMLTAGVPRSQANLVMELLTARAKVMNPENPAQWMRENGLKFQKGGNAIGFSQAQYKSDAKSIKEYVAKIKAANIPPQGKGKFFYSFKSSNGADFYIAHDDMKHSYEKHGLTDGQLDAVESNIENITGAAVDNKKKGHNNGVPVLAKIKTPAGMAGVAFGFHPNGTVGINTIFFDSEANIDNWLKKGGSSTIVPLEEQTSLTGNTPLSISNIQKALGIVKKENYDQVSATPEEIEAVRQQYEGTEQWMKAPNGKTTNLTEDQWLAVRTPAFKEWFGDWEKKPKQASKIVDKNGEPLVVYHGTTSKPFDIFDKNLIGTRYSYDEAGFFFTDKKDIAEDYAHSEFNGDVYGGVIPVFISSKNTLVIDNKWTKKNGMGNILKDMDPIEFWDEYQSLVLEEREKINADGIMIDDGSSKMVVAFEPNQIKSATGNNGEFSTQDNNIYKQVVGEQGAGALDAAEEVTVRLDNLAIANGGTVKGSFDPTRQEGQYVISLFKGADASTVIHETGHYFVETMWQAIMDGQASQQVEKDFDTLLEYAGMTRSQWAAADISGRRKAHEHLAEAFESYIMEGKAPNEQLRNAFRRFADWLKSVYKAIRRNSNSFPLTDEVRGVFDRMLAAEEDIQQEKRLNGYFEHLPKVITDSMSDATKARVEAFIDKARDKAVELLTKDAMSIYKEDQKEAIKDYRAEIIPEVEKEVGGLRVYKSGYTHADVKKYENLWAIVTGTDEVGRELTPEEEAWMMQVDLMAESLGYSSTDEMLQDVMKAPTFKQAVTKRVSERVNEKFLDVMADIRAHEEAVRRAIYNDDAGLLIGVEQQLIEEYTEKAMDAQAKKEATAKAKAEAGEQADENRPAPSLQSRSKEQMRERAAAYRQQARNVARADIARMTIAEVVKVQKFAALERKAAMKSAAAMAKKDYREALTQKNLQAYYHAMVQESMLAKRHVEKNKTFLRRMVKAKPEAWTSEKHFAEVSMLFMRMGIAGKKHNTTGRVGVSLAEYAELMNEQYDCAEFADWLLELPDSAMLTNAREMTLEQFEDVVNAVRNIKAIARAEKGEAMFNKGEAFAELKGTIIKNLSGLKTVFTPDPNHPTRAKLLDKMAASMETIDTFFQRLDGWKDGFFVNTFLARIKRSNDMEFDFKERFDNAVLTASKRWLPDKKAEAAAAQEKYYDELGTSVSKHILVKMLMNLGNKENAERLCETRPIGFEQSTLWVMADESGLSRDEAVDVTRTNLLEFLQNNLTAEDLRYAQDMVNAAGMFWAEKNNMEIRIKGFGMKKVEAEPAVLKINGKDVVFMGGYFPLMRNGELGSHPVSKEVGEDDPLQGRNIRTLHTNSGATKHRTRARYPVNLFPGAEMQVLYDSIHDLCWRETMNDFRRILNDSELFAMFKSKLGPARMRVFREMLEKAAQPYNSTSADLAEQTFGTALTWLRNKSANAVIMMNIKINLQNLGNIFLYGNAVEGFGYKDTISALGNYMINFSSADGYRSLTEFISSKSSFMRERMTIPDITVRDIQTDEQIKQSELEQKIMRIGSMMMAFTDGLTAKPVWMQAYSNAISNGKTEQEAIDYADMIIRRTIGSARMTDVSSLQRGGPIFKLLTMFQSFFNAQYNQWVREYGHDRMLMKQGNKHEAYERMFAFVMAKFLMMSIASLTLALENPFGDKDEDGWPDLLHEMKNYGFGLLGPAGQVGSVFVGKMLGMQEFDYRMSVVQSTLEKGFKVAGIINKAATGKAGVAEGIEAVTDVAGLAIGIPQQANRLLWNWYDILFNDMSPELSDLTRRRPKADR